MAHVPLSDQSLQLGQVPAHEVRIAIQSFHYILGAAPR